MTAKHPFPCSRGRKGRSPLQQAAFARSRGLVCNIDMNEKTKKYKEKEKAGSRTIQALRSKNEILEEQKKALASKAHNRLKVANRFRLKAQKLAAEQRNLLQDIKALKAKLRNQDASQQCVTSWLRSNIGRAKQSRKNWLNRARAAEKARQLMRTTPPKVNRPFQSKFDGAYSHQFRSLCRKLVISGVAMAQVPKVIEICAHTFGIKLSDTPDPRSIGRFVLEGGVAAKIQLGNILSTAEGVTTSMDSTSHRNINFSSMHIMVNAPNTHNQLYLAVESTTDHTSQTQVDVLKSTFNSICDTTRRAPKCETGPEVAPSTSDIARKLYGVNGDHANDQLKVAQLEKEWKIDAWTNHLGNLALLNLGEPESKAFYESVQLVAETEAGGSDIFLSLPKADQEDLLATEYQKQVWAVGKTKFDQAEPILKQDMSHVVRGGCCAHKDMNATKGGTTAMLAFWKANSHLSPPVKLFNKDNDATKSLSDPVGEISEAEQRAISLTEGGAIKLCSLAGSAYNHRDDKKGHQDSHAYYFAEKYGRYRRFADVSSVRYGSFIEAATELCTFLDAYIEYMEHTRKQRATGRLNHLESNIVKALNCPATLAELLCIALYGQLVSKPYMRLVRSATATGKGLADLVLLHTQVRSHLQVIISNPSLVLSLKSPIPSVTLDGSKWENPAVLTALNDHGAKLPYLSDLFVAFCQGALQTWVRFTDELAPGGPIASLTPEQRSKAFMPPTNDANEGALGRWRVWTRRYPSLTLHKYNAIAMNRANQTEEYIDKSFTLKQRKWTRAEARSIDSSKVEANRKSLIVAARLKEAARNEEGRLKRIERQNKHEEYVAGIKLVLNPTEIQKMVGRELNDQLKVYKKMVVLSSGQTFPVISKLNVAQKKELVAGLAQRYVQETSLHESAANVSEV